MYILGLNLSHDSSACLVKDGSPKVALALERLVRVKRGIIPTGQYTGAMADLIEYCLETEGIALADVDYFVGSTTETVDQKDEENLLHDIGTFPKGKILALPHPSHHLAHASGAFFSSGFRDAAVLIVDAYGSRIGAGREAESGFFFNRAASPTLAFRNCHSSARIAGTLREGRFVVPPELSGICEIYRIVTLALGFSQPGTYYDDAGKTMGLAPYGARLSTEPQMIRPCNDGLDFKNAYTFLRDNNVIIEADGDRYINSRNSKSPLSQFHKNLAAQVQWEFEEGCLYLVRQLLAKTGSQRLALGGGGFLNSVVNHRILRETAARELFIFPAATDDGNALGAAMFAHHVLLAGASGGRPKGMGTVYLGRSYRNERLESCLKAFDLKHERIGDVHDTADYAAKQLVSGSIIGWYQNCAEFGPRALGNRSLLANPMVSGIKDHLNAKVKFREAFRPFGASVTLEAAHELFDLAHSSSPYMLLVCSARKRAKTKLREVIHVDGTCRLQTVDRSDNPAFYQVIKSFGELTSLPVVLNTSLNVRGMPIVETPEDAMHYLLTTQINGLVMGPYWIKAPSFEQFVPVRQELAIAAKGEWLAGHEFLRLDDFKVSVWRADLGDPRKHLLSSTLWALLRTVDGRTTVADLAKLLDISLVDAVSQSLELYRMDLIYWGHLGPVGVARQTRAHFNLRE